MLGRKLNKRVRRLVGVTIGDDLAVSIDDDPTGYFPAEVSAPESDNGVLDGSPRTSLAPWRLSWARTPAELRFSDRVEVPDDQVYELIARPRGVKAGRRVIGFSAPALPVDVLYPRTATVHELGNNTPLAEITCNVYSERDEQQVRGDFQGLFAEAPASVWEHLSGTNLQLRFGDTVHKIADAILSAEAPYVSMTLRKAG